MGTQAQRQPARGSAAGEHGPEAVGEVLQALKAKYPGRMFGHQNGKYWSAGRPGDGILRADTPGELEAAIGAESEAARP